MSSSSNTPKHLRDHLWDIAHDGWMDAEKEIEFNKQRAAEHKLSGELQTFSRIPHRRRADARPPSRSGKDFSHVPGEDPAKWEKAHHFKRFNARPENMADSVWGCTGYAQSGLPESLAQIMPDSVRKKLKTAARDQLEADGNMPPALPKYRKLWQFQKRELVMAKTLTVPPRPPQTLIDKYPNYSLIPNPTSSSSSSSSSGCGCGSNNNAIRDSCVNPSCCPTCGTNFRPWRGGPQNLFQAQQQFQEQQQNGSSSSSSSSSKNNNNHGKIITGRVKLQRASSSFPNLAAASPSNAASSDNDNEIPHHIQITLPRSHVTIKQEHSPMTSAAAANYHVQKAIAAKRKAEEESITADKKNLAMEAAEILTKQQRENTLHLQQQQHFSAAASASVLSSNRGGSRPTTPASASAAAQQQQQQQNNNNNSISIPRGTGINNNSQRKQREESFAAITAIKDYLEHESKRRENKNLQQQQNSTTSNNGGSSLPRRFQQQQQQSQQRFPVPPQRASSAAIRRN